jgi:uncharacterized iron-regulated membrane protein
MNPWQRWLRQPQSLYFRKAIFQVHMWAGVGLGLYILMISLTGSALVYRREMVSALSRGPVGVVIQGQRMTEHELKEAAERAHSGYTVEEVFMPRDADRAVEVLLRRGGSSRQRLFDPYSGADLGDTEGPAYRFLMWLAELHDDLLAGRTGRLVNGVGAMFATLMALTGTVLWWPGILNWPRSLMVDWRRKRRRLNWSLHNALGFWFLLFVLMWGISGIYFSFPSPFNTLVDFFEPLDETNLEPRAGDTALFWLARLHFGRFGGHPVRILWTILGLVPAALAVTGGIMWWNRVVRRKPRAAGGVDYGR